MSSISFYFLRLNLASLFNCHNIWFYKGSKIVDEVLMYC
jgi:hypothetical protein